MSEEPQNTADNGKSETAKHIRLSDLQFMDIFSKSGLTEIVEATKAVNAFPSGASRDLYGAYPSFGKVIDVQSDRVLGLISKVLKWQNIKGNIQRRHQDEQFEMLLECNDTMMERIGSNLDELAGIKKNPQTVLVEANLSIVETGNVGSGAGSWNNTKNHSNSMAARLITAKNIARPQLRFPIPIDNSSSTAFVPKIKEKPNSVKPLAILPEYDEPGNIVNYVHPYEFELTEFTVPEAQLKRKSPQEPLTIAAGDLVYVDTVEQLHAALGELREATELGVDVEHHSYRTFQGFSCLLQVSTRTKDYLFDALLLREDMHVLNEVFTNPKILKILHGAEFDIQWLQRDLSLYIVNLFDTHQAAKVLNFSRLSLAYLLKHYCNIEADKTFQLADWRMRPLPGELIEYARQDTHYLIYIYERLTNDILDAAHNQTNLLESVYQRSTEICKKRYVKSIVGPETHLDLFRKSKRIFDNRQLFALREIFKWRDAVARKEDESYGYVLPNHMMLQISESLPREMQGILACCNPIPPLVRQNLHALHQIILRARAQPLVKPILESETNHRLAVNDRKDYNSKLYCPHDLSHCTEFRDDLPTLLNFSSSECVEQQAQKVNMDLLNEIMCEPVLSVFDMPDNMTANESIRHNLKILNEITFVSPYERYLAMLPIIEKEKLEEAARIVAKNKKRQLCPAAPTLDSLNVKQEDTSATDEGDSVYTMPVKELLKRKHDKTVTANDEQTFRDSPQPKRKKGNTATGTFAQQENSIKEEEPNCSQDMDDDEAEEVPSTYSAAKLKPLRPKRKKKNSKKKKIALMKSERKTAQPSTQAVQFDYSRVNFKKFQGGAQRAAGAELKPQFHGKGNNTQKINNKKFNKLFTFSNVKGNKK